MTAGPRRTLPALVVACIALIAVAPHASAVEATSQHVRELAQRATVDPVALEELRSIDSIDGRPVDLRGALAGFNHAEVADRVRTLAQSTTPQAPDPEAARGSAKKILSDARFRPSEPPRPFRGIFDRLGDFLDRILTKPIGRAFRALARWIPGGETTLWILIVGAIVALAVLVAMRLARRRARAISVSVHTAHPALPSDDPKDLERRAQEAEARGDHATAIRLRFVAGLLRLDRAGALDYDPSLTAGQVRRRLRLAPFDRVSLSFESVAYGGRMPDDDDIEISKTGWQQVLQGVAA